MNAATLQCPSCGAAAAPAAATCQHCGVALATLSCPACFSMMFQGTAYCPHCGSGAAHYESKAGPHSCPGCEGPMVCGTVGEVRFHECRRCHGLWLTTAMFKEICRTAEHQAAVLGQAQPFAPPTGLEPVRYRKCPDCLQLMNRFNFARCSGVIVDVCQPHGTWFDRDELHRIVRFIHEGGLERSRQQERERLKDDQRRAQLDRTSPGVDWQPAPVHSGAPELLMTVIQAAANLLGSWWRRH